VNNAYFLAIINFMYFVQLTVIKIIAIKCIKCNKTIDLMLF